MYHNFQLTTSVLPLKYVPKLWVNLVTSFDNFCNFYLIEIFSSGMSSKCEEDYFQRDICGIVGIYEGGRSWLGEAFKIRVGEEICKGRE